MTPNAAPLDPKVAERTMKIIWIAMSASLLLLPVVLHVAIPPEQRGTGAVPPALAQMLGSLAALLAIGVSIYRRWVYSDPHLTKLGSAAAQSAAGESVFLTSIQSAWLVCMALQEAVGLLGFALAFQTREPSRLWPFLAAALALNLLAYPRPLALLARGRELARQTGSVFALALLLGACSFRGGDFAPLAKEPETPCSREAEELCKSSLGSADFATCVKRETYRCELLEQQGEKPEE